jgi:hypothetical protein
VFEQAQASYDPNAVAAVLHQFPYHVDSLLAMNELYRSMGEAQVSCAWHEVMQDSFLQDESLGHRIAAGGGCCRRGSHHAAPGLCAIPGVNSFAAFVNDVNPQESRFFCF